MPVRSSEKKLMFRVLILCQIVLLFTTGTPCAGEPPFMEENGKA